ncbi:penicillin-binding transpeptidase domain-containing protein [Lacticaseibacillus brantae]|uniref:Cell division protein FtsI penicillin-binding protein 2 n=1 Tax=Lacticaseibacillus brantae DSM 23927 TaxID=1423727 RepID=A0A0R2B070_9LACO|nr:penicillin-binding transpeptidase domain-containing protein [Lacticaseibacillus brantae]KRM72506.1 Cell division protein FtsI penicillin-binding protein 2 [Lacticaseibacillus brantae DSM 23927]
MAKQGHQPPRMNRKRLGIFFLGLTSLVFLIFFVRMGYVALGGKVDSANLSRKRSDQYRSEMTLTAKRGTIYDASGNVIAESSNTYSIYAILNKDQMIGNKPRHVVDAKKTAQVLSRYLPLSEAAILKYLQPKKAVFQVEFGPAGKNLSLAIKQQIEKQKLPGIEFIEKPSRLYPNGTFASHLIGLAQGTDADNSTKLTGILGLEKQFNTVLTGTDGHQTAEFDRYGYTLPNSEAVTKKPVDGGNVYTTIDSGLQSYLETLMSDVATKYQPNGLNAVLMDAKTGAILAASQRPTFDPMTGNGLGNLWRDALVEDAYEPGSVLKIMTLAAAIDSGNYQPNTYYQSGSVNVGGSVIRDWQTSGWGTIPLSQAFPRSSNVGMVKIEQAMGAKTWKSYLDKFDFGQKTGIQLPGEVAGSISFAKPVDQAITSFGQGINVNMMQMLQAVSAIANDGEMIQPRIVSKVVSRTGKTTTYDKKVVGKPISASTAKEVMEAMRQVVTAQYGTGQAYKMPGVDLAVKTGTAQIASSKGGYLTGANNYTFSVAGIAPAKNPRYILYITMKQPQKMTEAAESILASIFKPLMTRALALGDSDENQTQLTKPTTIPSVLNQSLTNAQTALKDFTVTTIGTGNTVVQQLPEAHSQGLKKSRVLLLTNGAMTMPDVSGWAKSDVLKLAQLTGAKFNLEGDGFATHQSQAAGTMIGDAKITVTFQPK